MQFFRHPLLLLVVGSVLSALLAWQWQNRQKRNEIRVDLVSDMSDTIMSLVAVLKAARPSSGPRAHTTLPAASPSVDEAARTFEINRCIIGTKLEAHLFPGTAVPGQWDALGDGLMALFGSVHADAATWPDHRRRVEDALAMVDDVARRCRGPAATLKSPREAESAGVIDWESALLTLLDVKIRVIRAARRTRMPAFELRAVIPGFRSSW
jgi:hypothetical protein